MEEGFKGTTDGISELANVNVVQNLRSAYVKAI